MRRTVLALALLVTAAALSADTVSPRFYRDDPLRAEPITEDAGQAVSRELKLTWDVLWHLFACSQTPEGIRAVDVNTVDEVPDSEWYTNRDLRTMSQAELESGPSRQGPPVPPWTILSGKTDGVMPGFVASDAAGVRWFVKLDAKAYPELGSGAEVVSTRLMWALGYFVPDNQVAHLSREELTLAEGATFKDADGRKHPLTPKVLDALLASGARRSDGRYRVLASRAVEGRPIGPFIYSSTRSDDPNDLIPHEHRRSLRALRVFAAWLNHVDAKAGNTLDTIVERDGRRVVRHYLLDFGSTLGSAGVAPRARDEGNAYIFDRRSVAKSALTLGLAVPSWRRTRFEGPRSVGRFEGERFDAAGWKPRLPNPAFIEAMPDDLFWGATRLLFADRRVIEAAVRAAQYSDPEAGSHVVRTLLRRRTRIFESFLNGVPPITDVSLSAQDVLTFSNAAVEADVAPRPTGYFSWWYEFDNATDASRPLGQQRSVQAALVAPAPLPRTAGAYVRIDIAIGDSASAPVAVQVFFRRDSAGWSLVGLDRLPRKGNGGTRP